MKKYLFLAAAALGFAACAEKGLDNGPVNNGELEQSYVAITLAADDMATKVGTNPGGVYAEGTEDERAVSCAYVFFFKNGYAFPVTLTDGTSTNKGENNYLPVTLKGNKQNLENVSDIKDAVLILQKYKGEYPDQIVAVLNWHPEKESYTLDELKTVVTQIRDKERGYVMSNAVYANNASETVDAVALTAANIAKTEEEALNNPVTIYVERIAAKVEFSANNHGKFEVGKIGETTVWAQIKGFELYNDYETSRLIKKIDTKWTTADLGFNWNDSEWYRSYWATSIDEGFTNNEFSWNTDNVALGSFTYCGENTRTWSLVDDVRTKVIVKAQLVTTKDGKDVPVTVANWWGNDYIGEDALLDVVANTLKNTYFTSTDKVNFTGLTPDQIKCVARDPMDKNAYEVYFAIDDDSQSLNWYKYENNTYTAIKLEELNNELSKVRPAHVYTEGMTYYWTNIKHLGQEGKTGEFGVVRNHVYKVNISGITGYGTPVYNGATGFLTPEKPVDINSFVSAQINILSWRVVANDYPLN